MHFLTLFLANEGFPCRCQTDKAKMQTILIFNIHILKMKDDQLNLILITLSTDDSRIEGCLGI